MHLWELANASAIYAAGFVVLFVVFALLYRRALAQREELGLTRARSLRRQDEHGHHLVSAGVGVVALTIAAVGPLDLGRSSPTASASWGRRIACTAPCREAKEVLEQQLGERGDGVTLWPDSRVPAHYAQRRSHPPVVDPARPRSRRGGSRSTISRSAPGSRRGRSGAISRRSNPPAFRSSTKSTTARSTGRSNNARSAGSTRQASPSPS